MATTYNLAITRNPNFNTVLGLTNTVFDRNNVRSGQMATEDQIQQLWQDIIQLEERIDYCCRDIVFWDFRVRVRDKFGNIMSDYLENRRTGIMRRGKNYIMEIPMEPVPKYEVESTGAPSIATSWFVDGNRKKCILNGYSGAYGGLTIINDLCSIIYRGADGEYYEMSNRKTTDYLSYTGNSLVCHVVDENGNEGTYNIAGNNSTSNRNAYMGMNTHFAYVENGKIYVRVLYPVSNLESFNGSSAADSVKPYGRIYYLDVRDVTLGG